MTENTGWPAPLAGVLNPIDDPYAAAHQMAIAIVSKDSYKIGSDADEAALQVYELTQALLKEYLRLREFYDGSTRSA